MDALHQLDAHFAPTGGNYPTVNKPHLFVPRRYLPRKPVDKEDLPFPTFVHGLAGMILNALHDQSSLAAALARHMREVAEDAIDRPWVGVHEWSKCIFERLERKDISWDNYAEIQRERYKLSYNAQPIEKQVIPCPAFNGKGCQSPDTHEDGIYSLRHVCSFCYHAYSAMHNSHNWKTCNARKAAPNKQPDPRHDRHNKPKQGPESQSKN